MARDPSSAVATTSFHITPGMRQAWLDLPKPRATRDEIALIEATLDVALPEPYVDFVTEHGFVVFGRDPERRGLFSYAIERAGQNEVREADLSFLFRPERLLKVQRTMTTEDSPGDPHRPMIPPGYLAVGSDSSEGTILLDTAAHPGQVWFWPASDWRWGTEDNLALGFVADDFEAFINGLRPDPL